VGEVQELTWYVAYGSNLAAERFSRYVAGGRPEGATRTYAGCRDTSAPRDDLPVELPGEVLFAGQSTVWSGGMAFYDPEGAGTVAARAYLLGTDQSNDVVAQETRHPVGTDLGLRALQEGSAATVREGGYDSVLRLRDIDGLPAVTITARRSLEPQPPSAAYLRWICAGLHETHGWAADRIAGYLVRCGGVRAGWTLEALSELARSG
jgi:hypothetical protein